jgi:hypothetical protein
LDFWDLTALIFRRWKVSLPLLLVAVGATAFVALTAKPDYTMTSYVQIVPAKVTPTDNALNASMRNPWNQLGLATLGQASIYATQDQGFLDSLKAAKHTDNFTLTLTYPNPIVTVEVVAPTSADARETTELVINRLRSSAQALQKQSGVLDQDIIPTQRLDQGQNLVPSGGKVKRAIAAVAAAGLLMTVGGTVGFDAFARRRKRKREERAAEHERELSGSPPEEVPAAGVANGREAASSAKVPVVHGKPGASGGEPVGRASAAEAVDKPVERPPSPVRAAPSASMERTAIVVKRSASVIKHPPPAKSTRPPEAVTYKSANAQSEANADDREAAPAATNGDGGSAPSDVRVVLQPKWLGSENGGQSH